MADDLPQSPRIVRRLVAAVAAGALALVALEVALRVLGRFEPEPTWYVGELENRPSDNFVVDEHTGWHMRPGHHFTRPAAGVPIEYFADSGGLRVADPEVRPPAGLEGGIALVGDSQTWGFGVAMERSFGALVGQRLGVPVRNFAQPGFGIDQIGLALRHQALPQRPALVVVGVFRNDFNRSLQSFRFVEGFNKPTFVLDGGELRERTPEDRPGALQIWFERRSHLYTLLRDKLESGGYLEPDTSWQTLNEALLARMRDDARAAGVPIVFVRIPRALGTKFETLDAIAKRLELDYLDPARTPPEEADLYHADRHLNETGHRWVADVLERWIRTSGLDLGPAAERQTPND